MKSSKLKAPAAKSSKEQKSFTRDLVKQTFNSQFTEFFLMYGQRLFGVVCLIIYTYVPLHLAGVYSEELKWMVENHF